MKNSFFAFLSRMKHINRWGLMRNSRYENLAEHSFETAYIANALANIENVMFEGSYDAKTVTTLALFHDCPEIITGDLPTPVKYKHKSITGAYSQVEAAAKDTLLAGIEPGLRSIYSEYLDYENTEYYKIIKAADKLSALIKCREERKAGNTDFESAEKTILRSLDESGLESVEYFIRNILPMYSKTLDELSK